MSFASDYEKEIYETHKLIDRIDDARLHSMEKPQIILEYDKLYDSAMSLREVCLSEICALCNEIKALNEEGDKFLEVIRKHQSLVNELEKCL